MIRSGPAQPGTAVTSSAPRRRESGLSEFDFRREPLGHGDPPREHLEAIDPRMLEDQLDELLELPAFHECVHDDAVGERDALREDLDRPLALTEGPKAVDEPGHLFFVKSPSGEIRVELPPRVWTRPHEPPSAIADSTTVAPPVRACQRNRVLAYISASRFRFAWARDGCS